MTTGASENNNIVHLTYCTICDAPPLGGANPFLESLGEQQRNQKVNLSLESCKICEGTVWKISYTTD